jgi:hypothetical protein
MKRKMNLVADDRILKVSSGPVLATFGSARTRGAAERGDNVALDSSAKE